MKLMLTMTTNINRELPTAEAAQKRPRWIASAVSEPGHSVDVWRADRGVIDMNRLRHCFPVAEWMSGAHGSS
jgi:hypothetical protein